MKTGPEGPVRRAGATAQTAVLQKYQSAHS
jgi:hypothetical protein